jgi:molybdate-binding protein
MTHPRNGNEDTGTEPLLHDRAVRWATRQEGAGTSRFIADHLRSLGMDIGRLQATATARSEREAAAAVAMGQADVAPGTRSAAQEFGLSFIPLGWEYFDIVIEKRAYFRHLFQQLLERLRQPETRTLANLLGGYELGEAGRLLWAYE